MTLQYSSTVREQPLAAMHPDDEMSRDRHLRCTCFMEDADPSRSI